VRFFCTIDDDPFVLMEEQGKKYGFTIALPEYERGIKSLWDAVKEFTAANPDLVSSDNALGFLSDDGGQSYNNCACTSIKSFCQGADVRIRIRSLVQF
jgi:alpha 1,2-mannosyltransferase